MFREKYDEEEFRRWLMTKVGSDTAYCYSKIVSSFFRQFDELNEENINLFLERTRAGERAKRNYRSALNAYKRFLGQRGLIKEEEERDEEIEGMVKRAVMLMEGRYAKHTIKQTREHSRKWLYFLKKQGKRPDEATEQDAQLFLAEVAREKGVKRNTLISYVKNLRRLCDLLQLPNPFLKLRIKPERPLPRYLSEEEVRKLIKAAEEMGPREAALIKLLYSSGIRISEATELRWCDVDLRGRKLVIKPGKTGEGRIAFFNEEAAIALGKWRLRTRWPNDTDRVFLVRNPMSLTLLVRKIGERAGIYVTPHMLRHSLAVHMMKAGISLRIVQEVLGHKYITTTQIYTKITQKDVESKYREFWKEKEKST